MIEVLVRGSYKLTWSPKGGWSGNAGLLLMLEDAVGKLVELTPVGPTVQVSLEEPRSVIGYLRDRFQQAEVTGDLPSWPFDETPQGAIF